MFKVTRGKDWKILTYHEGGVGYTRVLIRLDPTEEPITVNCEIKRLDISEKT